MKKKATQKYTVVLSAHMYIKIGPFWPYLASLQMLNDFILSHEWSYRKSTLYSSCKNKLYYNAAKKLSLSTKKDMENSLKFSWIKRKNNKPGEK